jgi:hypothetical protein
MPRKYTIRYREALEPIREPVTKFGGRPVWIAEPQWPMSHLYDRPMHFVCQIVLDPALFGELPTRMAYVFLTDWDGESVFPDTMEPDGGENAVIVQPGGTWVGECLPLSDGPGIYRRAWRNERWEQTPCELAVELHPGEDPHSGVWDEVDSDNERAWAAYFAALYEDKIGGTPVPTPFGSRFEAGPDQWRLLLQLSAKDNDQDSDPFFLNLASDGVGYAFLSPDGRGGKFLWNR